YGRIVALLTALYYSTTPTIAAPLYLISFFLDEFDGYAARTLNQTPIFVLKQIINVIQLLVAAIKIVEVDQKKRD
ncbi:uncharacterized protein LOC121391188, partial [Gigantopelta aegis]|uniref:uncharacterized protein LOC121391188 n=1 Tax=Gigantopelta aegis TaxID=1735272 RepID=UPI001B8883FC